MIERCYSTSFKQYKDYGGRGIVVDAHWHDPSVFIRWAKSNGFSPELELDRIDTDGPYSPENCRWVTKQENLRNKRSRQ